MDTKSNPQARDTVMSREIAELDVQMNAKESFAARVGLLPFTVGAVAAVAALVVAQLITRL
jgi:hypothetical protein